MNKNIWIDADAADELEDSTVGSVYESIETNLWQADGYLAQGATGLATECLRAAWLEYVRFRDILVVYGGIYGEDLGGKLVRALVERAGDSAASLALGTEPKGRLVWDALIAA